MKAIFAGVATLGLAACQTTPTPNPGEDLDAATSLADEFRPFVTTQGYVPLAFPTTAYAPGAIVEIRPGPDGRAQLSYYSDMRTCGATEADLRVVTGAAPGVSSNRTFTAGANLSLELPTATIGPKANLVRSAKVSFGAIDVASLDQIAIEAWRDRLLDAEDGAVPDACLRIVEDTPENLFIIREALALRNGAVTYEAEVGAEAALSADLASIVATIPSAGANFKFDNDRTVSFDGPLYIGVKRMAYIGGEARRLGDDGIVDDPALLDIPGLVPSEDDPEPNELDEAELRAILGPVAAN